MSPNARSNKTGVAAAMPQMAQMRAEARTSTANAIRKRDAKVTGAIEPAGSYDSGGARSAPDKI